MERPSAADGWGALGEGCTTRKTARHPTTRKTPKAERFLAVVVPGYGVVIFQEQTICFLKRQKKNKKFVV